MQTVKDAQGALRNANGKPCGYIYYQRKWFRFCGMEQVKESCHHAQLPPKKFLEEYNKQFAGATMVPAASEKPMKKFLCIEGTEKFTLEAENMKQAQEDAAIWNASVIHEIK